MALTHAVRRGLAGGLRPHPLAVRRRLVGCKRNVWVWQTECLGLGAPQMQRVWVLLHVLLMQPLGYANVTFGFGKLNVWVWEQRLGLANSTFGFGKCNL